MRMRHQAENALEQKLKDILQTSATVHVGKLGITPTLIQETINQLDIKDAVKIRFLKSVEDPKLILTELAQSCNAKIWKHIGRVGILVLK